MTNRKCQNHKKSKPPLNQGRDVHEREGAGGRTVAKTRYSPWKIERKSYEQRDDPV